MRTTKKQKLLSKTVSKSHSFYQDNKLKLDNFHGNRKRGLGDCWAFIHVRVCERDSVACMCLYVYNRGREYRLVCARI